MKFLFFIFLFSATAFSDIPSFKFHLKSTPKLDPTLMTSGENTYLFSQLYRGLTRFDGNNELIFDQAKKCKFKIETELVCELRKESKWNDGTQITAQDFVRGFTRLVSPKSECPVVDLLFGIKNAKEIYEGKLPVSSLGIKAISPSEIQFSLTERDTEFLEKLSNPLFVPYRDPKNPKNVLTFYTNGPYKVKTWIPNQKIELAPFTEYFGGRNPRPNVEVVFATEDAAGLVLYEKGITNFLYRLTTINIPKYKDRPDFVQVPQSRYDYIGFNMRPGSIFEKKEIREAFTHAVNFDDFKKIFFAMGAPGCPGLIPPFLDSEDHCQEFIPDQKKLTLPREIKFMFSQSGGDDIRRAAEWFQEQWRDHLGVQMQLRGMEQKQYIALLKSTPPDAFRTGVGLNRPTCSAALEKFETKGLENFVGFSNLRFDNLVHSLSHDKLSMSEKASVCGVASDILFKEEFVGIPLGQIHFSLLVRPEFKGWSLNELNQLDLSQLTYVKK